MNFFKKLPLNIIFLICTVVILTLLCVFIGFTIWLIVFLILSLFLYFLFFTKIFKIKPLKPLYIWIFLGAFLLLNVTTVVLVKNSSKNTSLKPLTEEECQAIYEEYDSTILDLTSDGLKGTIGIKIDQSNCEATVSYNFIYTTNLNKNFQISEYAPLQYEYAGVLRDPNKERNDSSYGVIFPAYKNKGTLPNPYYFGLDAVDYGDWTEADSTTTFYHGWQSKYIFRENSFEKITAKTLYEVLDGSNAMNVTQTGEGAHSYSLDAELAAKQGSVVKSFNLTITKRN
jgi:hypothetical protein